LIQEKPWRPADYWPQSVYVPPQIGTNWAFEAPTEDGSAERMRDSRYPRRGARARTAWRIIAWTFTCGLVAGIVMAVLAVLVIDLA
jgi:hypothetical protein